MKVLSGRYGHYQILQTNDYLLAHLLDTHVFSEASLSKCMKKSNKLLIRPLVGPACLQVRRLEIDHYEVQINEKKIQCSTIHTLYKLIRENLNDKSQYIIQSFPHEIHNHQKCYYTLHRKSQLSTWRVVHKTAIAVEKEKKRYDLFRHWNLMNFLLEVGKTLGKAFPHCSTIVVEITLTATDFLCTDMIVHYRNSKWSQYHSLGNKWFSKSILPKTDLCTKRTLQEFMNKMNDVILKPCIGQQGKGIVKIHETTKRTYKVYYRNTKKEFESFEELFRFMEQTYLVKSDYLIQQFIPLRTIDQCPYDLRVITQMNNGKWQVTGMLIKVAATNYFVTNRAQKLLTINALHDFSSERVRKTIEKLCLKASKLLEESAAPLAMIGFDVAVDVDGKLWILEANYTPDLSMFYGLGNNEMYQKMHHFIRLQKRNRNG